MTIINLFHCCEKLFILINISMIRKNFDETSLPEKQDFTVT